ncbi:16010_t:CDS:2 [Gigaspora margarita]|uniref:16010_t:CDS:1 n=1 Tax=Gigaspora margarita TaxID=4874 RepID=A0ABN7U700_GIGMA|nr:16010_t:CDS:2 [Gigaspora margarita]
MKAESVDQDVDSCNSNDSNDSECKMRNIINNFCSLSMDDNSQSLEFQNLAIQQSVQQIVKKQLN